jgi:hypothetical protein
MNALALRMTPAAGRPSPVGEGYSNAPPLGPRRSGPHAYAYRVLLGAKPAMVPRSMRQSEELLGTTVTAAQANASSRY